MEEIIEKKIKIARTRSGVPCLWESTMKFADLRRATAILGNTGKAKAAVFVNNFTNNLYKIGNDICKENNIPFEILLPLIKETAEKINQLSPKDAQTGPAKRNDVETINSHLAFLSDENQKNIYKILTQSIQNNGKKL